MLPCDPLTTKISLNTGACRGVGSSFNTALCIHVVCRDWFNTLPCRVSSQELSRVKCMEENIVSSCEHCRPEIERLEQVVEKEATTNKRLREEIVLLKTRRLALTKLSFF